MTSFNRRACTLALLGASLLASASAWAAPPVIHSDGKTMSFALSGKYPPFNFVNDQGQLDGFDVEMGRALAQRSGLSGQPLATAWDGIIAGLLANKYDAIIGSMAITAKRQEAVNFTQPYYRSGAQLFTRQDSDLRGVADLKGKKVGVTLGTTYEAWVRENMPSVQVVTYKGVPEMMLEMGNRRIDGFITDKLVGLIAIKDKKAPMRMVGDLLYPELIGIAVNKNNPQLLDALNQALAAMQSDGSYAALSQKWFGADVR
jgi:ABC-type amino acid transport substrate-binding protein